MPLKSNKKRVAGSSHPVNRPGICDSDMFDRSWKGMERIAKEEGMGRLE